MGAINFETSKLHLFIGRGSYYKFYGYCTWQIIEIKTQHCIRSPCKCDVAALIMQILHALLYVASLESKPNTSLVTSRVL
jgi:hypothetical protein